MTGPGRRLYCAYNDYQIAGILVAWTRSAGAEALLRREQAKKTGKNMKAPAQKLTTKNANRSERALQWNEA
jgi:hypothetical protein